MGGEVGREVCGDGTAEGITDERETFPMDGGGLESEKDLSGVEAGVVTVDLGGGGGGIAAAEEIWVGVR